MNKQDLIDKIREGEEQFAKGNGITFTQKEFKLYTTYLLNKKVNKKKREQINIFIKGFYERYGKAMNELVKND